MLRTLFFLIQKFWTIGVAMILTVLEQVATAVVLPDTLRGIQQFAGRILDWAESYFTIPAQYMVWVEMAGIDEKLVFMAFYFANLLLLVILWRLLKRMWRKIFKRKPPAAE